MGGLRHRMRITRTGPVEAQSPWSSNPARTAALSPAIAEVASEAADDEAASREAGVDDAPAAEDTATEDAADAPKQSGGSAP